MVRFLVVDDNRAHRQLFSRQLDEMGYHFDVAVDGTDALQLAQKQMYDVALLDYELPGENGIEVFLRLKELQPSIRGVMVTAFASLNTVYPAMGVGVDKVIAKPVDVGELKAVLSRILDDPGTEAASRDVQPFPSGDE